MSNVKTPFGPNIGFITERQKESL